MAAVARRWIRTHCESCAEPQEFEVTQEWVLVCTRCKSEKRLGRNGLLLVA